MAEESVNRELVRELATLLDETEIHEIEYATEALRVRVVRHQAVQHVAAAPQPAQAPAAQPAAPETAGAQALGSDSDLADHPGAVTSPMVGVAYHSPEPGAPPFVSPGDQVKEGQTLMLIEAMKTFNPIPAPRDGTVSRVVAGDSAPVEYGEPLVILE